MSTTAPLVSPLALGARSVEGAPLARSQARSVAALKAAAGSWFVVAMLGQAMLALYVVGFYLRAAVNGDFEAWNKVLPHGHVPGDTAGNLVVLSHLVFAVLLNVGGALQLVPAVRRIAPAFHRWNGRVFLFSAVVASVGGFIMVWTRGAVGGTAQLVAINLNALLILLFAAMTLRHALARRIDAHRRWALRLFLVVSGVFFFRVGLMFWLIVNQGPVGFDPGTFRGPALSILAFAQFLVPLAVLELYFRAQASRAPAARFAMAGALGVLTLVTAVGVAGATTMLWLPRL